jgi:hypothetical protein
MFGSSSEPAPDCWEPPVGGSIAEPFVPRLIVLFGLRACWFESFPFDVQLPRIEPGRIVLPADEPGVTSWSLDMGVELPVRYCGLTLGRYVLVSASPTTGVDFSPASRAEAISMVVPVGALIAEAMIAESEGTAATWSAAPRVAPNPDQRPSTSGDASMRGRSHRRTVARQLRRTSRGGRGDLE